MHYDLRNIRDIQRGTQEEFRGIEMKSRRGEGIFQFLVMVKIGVSPFMTRGT
jgi:hypothetical protein